MVKRLTRFIRQFKYGEKGFTLIELLVVVAILGVLAAVAIPNIAKFANTGDLASANTELSVAQTAQAAYMADHQNTPTNDLTATGLQAYSNKAFVGKYVFDLTPANATYGQLIAGTIYPGTGTQKFALDVDTASKTYGQFK